MRSRRSRLRILAPGLLAVASLALGSSQSQRFQQAVDLMETKGDYPGAIRLFEEVAGGDDRSLAARALLYIGLCQEKLSPSRAEKAYRQVLQRFSEQREVALEARGRLAALGGKLGSTASAMLARQVWAGDDVDTQGAPSPDGRYLPYVAWQTGQLMVRDLSAGTSRRLTSAVGWDSGFSLNSLTSDDGRQVAYVWFNGKFYDLRLTDVEGSEHRVLYSNEETSYIHLHDWSRDGKNVLALLWRKDGGIQIALVSVADGSANVLKTLHWRWPGKMSLSPGGRHLVYDFPQADGSLAHDIFLLATDGSREVALVTHAANDLAPLWTPDGKRIVFLSDRTGSLGLWLLDVSDIAHPRPPQLLKEDMGRIWPIGLTRQGAYYYALQIGMSDVYIASLDPDTGKLSSPPKPLSDRLVGARQGPDWSPDGKQLVYPSERGPTPRQMYGSHGTLSIYSLETGEERELRTSLVRLGGPRWLPDGRSILVKGWDEKEREGAYVIDIETGRLTTLVQPQGYMQMPELSPDGNTLFYRLGTAILITHDLETGSERELYRSPAAFNYLTASPDGRDLALARNEPKEAPALVVMPASGGEAREILSLPSSERFAALAWTPDGRQLFFGKSQRDSTRVEVWRVPAAGGAAQKTELAMESLRGLRFHPDGRRVAFASGEYAEEVWVLENFLPPLPAGPSRE